MTPKETIIHNLESVKFMNAGHSLSVLCKAAFGDLSYTSKKETQKILQKLKRERKVMYFSETKVWFWIG